MSGPKCADVEPSYYADSYSQYERATTIAQSEDAAMRLLLREAESIYREAETLAGRLSGDVSSLPTHFARLAPDATREVSVLAEAMRQSVRTARDQLRKAQEARGVSQQSTQTTSVSYARANAAHSQGAAQDGTVRGLFNSVAHELKEAVETSRQATDGVRAAARLAREARSAAQNVQSRLSALRAEADAYLRAEEEAKRSQQEQQRQATIAIGQANAALKRLENLPHEKFRPGEVGRLRRSAERIERLLSSADYEEATEAALLLQHSAKQLDQEITVLQQELESRRTEAETLAGTLEACFGGTNRQLLEEWADDPAAYTKVEATLEGIRVALKSEQFEFVAAQAPTTMRALEEATTSAATNSGQHIARQDTDQAVMASLKEMNMDVFYTEGTRTEPSKIVGQTSDETGRGDIEISNPLVGKVDFLVETANGDASCVAAVLELQERLAQRGVNWKTTDWGHASGVQFSGEVEKQKQQTQAKTKAKG